MSRIATLLLKSAVPVLALSLVACDTGAETEEATSEPAAETAPMDMASARQGIDETNRAAEEALAAGDVAGFVSRTYTEDATIIPPGGSKISGQAAIEEFWKSAGEQLGLTGIQLQTEEVVQAGPDMAYEIGTGVLETAQGPSEANYVVIWRRGDDGQWRWHVDIWNAKATAEEGG